MLNPRNLHNHGGRNPVLGTECPKVIGGDEGMGSTLGSIAAVGSDRKAVMEKREGRETRRLERKRMRNDRNTTDESRRKW